MTPAQTLEVTTFDDLVARVNVESPFAAQAPGEKDDTFLRRLAGATSSLQDGNWKALKKESQDWYNEAAKAINGMQPMPVPEGFVSVYQGPVEAPPAAAPTKAVSESGGTTKVRAGKGLMHHAREVALQHLDWHSEQVGDQMRSEGWEVPKSDSVWIATKEVSNVLKAIDSIGMKLVPK